MLIWLLYCQQSICKSHIKEERKYSPQNVALELTNIISRSTSTFCGKSVNSIPLSFLNLILRVMFFLFVPTL